jgi:hypothetical protein
MAPVNQLLAQCLLFAWLPVYRPTGPGSSKTCLHQITALSPANSHHNSFPPKWQQNTQNGGDISIWHPYFTNWRGNIFTMATLYYTVNGG